MKASRSVIQKVTALVDSSAFVDSLPPHSLVVYLGWASQGDPVSGGVGAFVVYSHPDGTRLTHHFFHPLGHHTHSTGILWGVGMALTFFSENQTLKNNIHLCSLYFLTDHHWAVNAFQKGVPSKHNDFDLISKVREVIRRTVVINYPKVCWLPGNTPGFNSAVSLASRASITPINPRSLPGRDDNMFSPPIPVRFGYSTLRGTIVSVH